MKNLLDKYLPLRAPDAPGSAPAAPPAVAPPAGGDQPSAPSNSPPPPAPGEQPAAGPYRPDGLPDTMFGKDDRETIDKVHNALKGYRERDATRVVPDKPEAYREFGDMKDVPEPLKPHLQALARDPLFDAVSKVAMEEKIPVATMQKLTTALYAQAQEAGILDTVVDPVAERAALLPEAAKSLPKDQQDAAINARLQKNEDFVKLMVSQGLPQEAADEGLLMLMDTAKGNQFIEFFSNKMTGGDRNQPFSGQGNAAGADSKREALRAQLAAPEMNPQHPKFDKAKHDALDAEYKKMFPG